jgi:hypothetical protein
MPKRTVLLLGLLIAICLAILALSAYATNRLSTGFVPLGARENIRIPGLEPLGQVGPRGPRPEGWREVVAAGASFCFLYLVSLVALFLFPRRLRLARNGLMAGWGPGLRLLGIGLLAGVAALLLTVLGTFAVVAFPVSLLLLAGLLVAVWGGTVAVALALGHGITRWAGLKTSSPVFDLALGILIVFTLGRIPVAGWVFVAILCALALGIVIDSRFGAGGPWSLADFQIAEEASDEQA